MEIKFCSYCGGPHKDTSCWPRECARCGEMHWRNPVPVSVVLLPVDTGVLTVRRAIPPGEGRLALPGGFVDGEESWQQAAVREVMEETGLVITADELRLLRVETIGNVMLLFCRADPRREVDLNLCLDPTEVSEVVIVQEPCELAFPTHTEVLADYWRA